MQLEQKCHAFKLILNSTLAVGFLFDLIKVAIAHHRFVWIHPFGNGNGRVVRLLTYALLIKYGFGANKLELGTVFVNCGISPEDVVVFEVDV